jgi:hypothetical protein
MITSLNTFDYIPEEKRSMYSTAYDAITPLELWPFMKNFNEDNFMFSSAPEIQRIYNQIEVLGYTGHSGSSFGFIMRSMEYIGKHGIKQFEEEYNKQN